MFDFLKRNKPRTTVTVEMEIKGLKDLEKLERSMAHVAGYLEKAAEASERLADAMAQLGIWWEVDE